MNYYFWKITLLLENFVKVILLSHFAVICAVADCIFNLGLSDIAFMLEVANLQFMFSCFEDTLRFDFMKICQVAFY